MTPHDIPTAAVRPVGSVPGRPAQALPNFLLEEATIDSIHAAFADGTLTCVELITRYLSRIQAYDKRGPTLRAILTVAPDALALAAQRDAEYAASGLTGPLHGIPIILKDNYDTHDLPTSGANILMKHSQPAIDAFVVAKMRKAGAIILAKANMQEIARGGSSVSSLGGQVLNPYDLTRNPGGSSGGSGAAIAANFAVIGTGSDTGQSTRSPASANCLVGIRPTRGLVSRGGIMPNSLTQDEIGPIARTVKDAARLLSVMAGYDPKDPVAAFGVGRTPADYADLNPQVLDGARIGYMTNMAGTDERHADVNRVMKSVIAGMRAQGATVVCFALPEYDALAEIVGNSKFEAAAMMEKYFAALGPRAPVTSFKQLVQSRTAEPEIQATLEHELAMAGGMDTPEYHACTRNRDTLRLAVAAKMADLSLDAILYPLQKVLVAKVGQPQLERNGTLSNGTGFPAVTFPGGFSTPTLDAPLGVPVGAELLGRDFSEHALLSMAYAFEQTMHVRKAPMSTPGLGGE